MGLHQQLASGLQRLSGIYMLKNLPRGLNFLADIGTELPGVKVNTIFDVGANVGQSALEYVRQFPAADILCFEPIAATFTTLSKRIAGTNARAYQLALSDRDGGAQMRVNANSELSSLDEGGNETVQLRTLDSFCAAEGVDHISLLKIDTEGHDLAVLRGAKGMLSRATIDIVQVEAGMNPGNNVHVPFDALRTELERHGYRLFGIYSQVREWPTRQPQLRRTNPAFISPNVIDANGG